MHQQKVILHEENLNADPGSHIVLLYQDKSELLEFLPNYYCAGFKSNDVCFLVMDNDNLTETIKNAILSRNVIDRAQMAERLSLVDYQKLYFSVEPFDMNMIFTKIDDMIEKNNKAGIRTCGDMTWVNAGNFKDFFEYECGLTQRYSKENIILMCAYCIDDLDASQLLQMMQAHTLVLSKKDGKWKLSSGIDQEIYQQKLSKSQLGDGHPDLAEIRRQIKAMENGSKEY